MTPKRKYYYLPKTFYCVNWLRLFRKNAKKLYMSRKIRKTILKNSIKLIKQLLMLSLLLIYLKKLIFSLKLQPKLLIVIKNSLLIMIKRYYPKNKFISKHTNYYLTMSMLLRILHMLKYAKKLQHYLLIKKLLIML